MPVLTKINSNVIADDAITGDMLGASAYLANTANQNISGTYSENRLYTSDAYTLSGNATINSHLTLSTVKPTDDVVLTAGGAYTLTGTGVLSAGSLLAKERTDLTGMTGELGSAVTGAPALTGLGSLTSLNIADFSTSARMYDVLYGSVHSKIFYFQTVIDASNNKVVSISNNSATGLSITALEPCMCWVNFGFAGTGADITFGLSKNSSQMTTAIYALISDTILCQAVTRSGGQMMMVGWSGILAEGDVIRPHGDGGGIHTSAERQQIHILATKKLG